VAPLPAITIFIQGGSAATGRWELAITSTVPEMFDPFILHFEVDIIADWWQARVPSA
jgi:hypothetical protein